MVHATIFQVAGETTTMMTWDRLREGDRLGGGESTNEAQGKDRQKNEGLHGG